MNNSIKNVKEDLVKSYKQRLHALYVEYHDNDVFLSKNHLFMSISEINEYPNNLKFLCFSMFRLSLKLRKHGFLIDLELLRAHGGLL